MPAAGVSAYAPLKRHRTAELQCRLGLAHHSHTIGYWIALKANIAGSEWVSERLWRIELAWAESMPSIVGDVCRAAYVRPGVGGGAAPGAVAAGAARGSLKPLLKPLLLMAVTVADQTSR
jgi:hypothetical protein